MLLSYDVTLLLHNYSNSSLVSADAVEALSLLTEMDEKQVKPNVQLGFLEALERGFWF